MSNGIIKVRKSTGIGLAIFVVILAILGALGDFELLDFSLTTSMIISLALVVFLSLEVSLNSILRRRFDAFEIIATVFVGLALLSLIFNFFDIENAILGGISGTIKIVLLILSIVAVFTAQKGE